MGFKVSVCFLHREHVCLVENPLQVTKFGLSAVGFKV